MENGSKKESLNAAELKREIEMQTKALKMISRWTLLCLCVSGIGVVFGYLGLLKNVHPRLFGILGVALMVIGLLVALVLAYGHRNGRRNVEHMINALEAQVKKKDKKSKKKR